jgi:hypothetical protein
MRHVDEVDGNAAITIGRSLESRVTRALHGKRTLRCAGQ